MRRISICQRTSEEYGRTVDRIDRIHSTKLEKNEDHIRVYKLKNNNEKV